MLKCGAAYVPIDPQAPVARAAYIAGNCGVRCLLTGAEKRSAWRPLHTAGAPVQHLVVVNDAAWTPDDVPAGLSVHSPDDVAAQPGSSPDVRPIDLDLAYILYTSGSTGQPKGVMLSHRKALTFVDWGVAEFAVTADDRLSSHAPLHFDLSVFDPVRRGRGRGRGRARPREDVGVPN